jgi:sec-independent protein translocase protein TatB
MFGIGLPEMIVILAVALIVVGPDKLPELARSLAKGLHELKKTVNQVKENFNEEGNVLNDVQETVNQVKKDLGKDGNLLGDVQGELERTADDLRNNLQDTGSSTWLSSAGGNQQENDDDEVIDLQPLEERPWEKDRKKEPEKAVISEASAIKPLIDDEQKADTSSKPDKPSASPA